MNRNLAILLLLWAALSALSIALHGPVPLFSTRTLGVAWEMWNRHDFLVPVLNGEPYSHKTPLLYWLYHLGWAVGGVGIAWPSAVMVAISTAFLFATARLALALFPGREATARYAPWIVAALPPLFVFALQFMFELLLGLGALVALIAIAPAIRGERPRWGWFALALGAGLLTKGPVALLHVAFPLVAAPWWSELARRDLKGWYLRAVAAIAGGFAVFAAWLVPALVFGGDRYRNEVLWKQTAGRVVDSFDHARPIWWYLPCLLVLLFPWWLFWPAWRAAIARATPLGERRLEPGVKFLLAGLVPTFVVFSLVSGKQFYYLMPWLALAAILIARVLDRGEAPADAPRVPWVLAPLALLLAGAGAMLLLGHAADRWLAEFASGPKWLECGFIVVGAALLWPTRARGLALAPRVASAMLLATVIGHGIFTAVLWESYDVEPAARVVAREQAAGRLVAASYTYEGEYHYLGRLTAPLVQLADAEVPAWAQAHPDDVVIVRPSRRAPRPTRAPLFAIDFREREVQIWRARDWLAEQQDGG